MGLRPCHLVYSPVYEVVRSDHAIGPMVVDLSHDIVPQTIAVLALALYALGYG